MRSSTSHTLRDKTPAAVRPTLVTAIPPLPPRDPHAHKGTSGRVVILAGSRGMSGAAILAGLAALRSGAGLVQVCVPKSILPIVAGYEPSYMTVALAEDSAGRVAARQPELASLLASADAVAIGPGLSRGPGVTVLCRTVLARCAAPLVIDADAINALAALPASIWRSSAERAATILTPHPGEMSRLLQQFALSLGDWNPTSPDDRLRIALECSRATGAIMVLKGRSTVVCEAGVAPRALVNSTGNPGMAAGGMGDVLTGLIAALLAQGMAAFDAACLAVHAHGAAADKLASQLAPTGYLPREVADRLPAALHESSRTPIGFR